MKTLVLVSFLTVASMARGCADTIEATITGDLIPSPPLGSSPSYYDFYDSSVSLVGSTPFTFSMTYDSNAQLLQFPGQYADLYPSENMSLSFGDYNESAASIDIGVTSQGIRLLGPIFTVNGAEMGVNVYLTPSEPFATDDLSNLEELNFYRLSGAGLIIEPIDDSSAPTLVGYVNSLSIQDLSVPEPSTLALMLGGLGLLAFWHRRGRRA